MMDIEKHYNYWGELVEQYKIDDLDSLTLCCRINGFVNACGIDLSDSVCEKLISTTRVPYINKKLDTENLKYNINFARCYDEKGKNFTMLGKYNDLDILFITYCDKDRNKNKLNDLPFSISLDKEFNGYVYSIKMDSVKGSQVKFDINKSKEEETLSNKLVFYANIKSFDIILKLVRLFNNNPEIVFSTYNEIMNQKRIDFSSKELNEVIPDEEKGHKLVKNL